MFSEPTIKQGQDFPILTDGLLEDRVHCCRPVSQEHRPRLHNKPLSGTGQESVWKSYQMKVIHTHKNGASHFITLSDMTISNKKSHINTNFKQPD